MESRIIRKRINRVCFAIFIFIAILTALQLGVSFSEMLFSPDFLGKNKKIEFVLNIIEPLTYIVAYFVPVLIFKRVYAKEHIPMRTAPRLGNHPIPMIFASLSICLAASHFWSYISSGESDVQIYHGDIINLSRVP